MKGFTLLELLLTIGILAILGTVTVAVLSPIELLAQARDAKRLSEINLVNKALGVYESQGGIALGSPNTIYISLPNTISNCTGSPTYSLPPTPPGFTYACPTAENLRKTNGTGWLPINFSSLSLKPFATLPTDPTNSDTSGTYYAYVTSGTAWILSTLLESDKQLKLAAVKDGGTDNIRFETGNNIGLWTQASGLAGHWKFNDGTGNSATDSSDKGNNGTLNIGELGTQTTAEQAWSNGTNGKVGGSLNLDGTDDYVRVSDPTNADLDFGAGQSFSVALWFKTSSSANPTIPVSKGATWGMGDSGYEIYLYPTAIQFNIDTNGATAGNYVAAYNTAMHMDNQWHFIVATRNGSDLNLYFDGTLVKTVSNDNGSVANTKNFTIGARYNATWFLNGPADEVRIWNRALSNAEVATIYKAEK